MKQLELNIHSDEKIVNEKIKEQFTLKNATIYGGYNLFSDYVACNGLDRLLEQEFGGVKAPWATYPMPMVCRTLIDGYALGLKNIYQFEGIENDPLLSAKRGMEGLPDQTVLHKYLTDHFRTNTYVDRLRSVKARQVKLPALPRGASPSDRSTGGMGVSFQACNPKDGCHPYRPHPGGIQSSRDRHRGAPSFMPPCAVGLPP